MTALSWLKRRGTCRIQTRTLGDWKILEVRRRGCEPRGPRPGGRDPRPPEGPPGGGAGAPLRIDPPGSDGQGCPRRFAKGDDRPQNRRRESVLGPSGEPSGEQGQDQAQ